MSFVTEAWSWVPRVSSRHIQGAAPSIVAIVCVAVEAVVGVFVAVIVSVAVSLSQGVRRVEGAAGAGSVAEKPVAGTVAGIVVPSGPLCNLKVSILQDLF